MAYQVILYWDRRGKKPVQDFIGSLSTKTQQKIAARIGLLSEQGPFLRRPYADKLGGKLYELRIRFASDNIRVLYYFFLKDKIVVVHAFRKHDWAIHPSDVRLAEARMKEFSERYEKGEITF